jgi:hypothetical protein
MRFTRKVILVVVLGYLCVAIGGVKSTDVVAGVNINGMLDQAASQTRPLSQKEMLARIEAYVPELLEQGASKAISVQTLDPNMATTNTVAVSWDPGDPVYWWNYSSGGAQSRKVEFICIPLFSGSNVDLLYHTIAPMGSSTNIIEPFGIAQWGGDTTLGFWLIVARNDLGEVAYNWFEAVP